VGFSAPTATDICAHSQTKLNITHMNANTVVTYLVVAFLQWNQQPAGRLPLTERQQASACMTSLLDVNPFSTSAANNSVPPPSLFSCRLFVVDKAYQPHCVFDYGSTDAVAIDPILLQIGGIERNPGPQPTWICSVCNFFKLWATTTTTCCPINFLCHSFVTAESIQVWTSLSVVIVKV